ncbi:hypothetical protein LTR09_010686 [Extremus antarcticus]|uniref:Uncharacterized protein n=1 Tax=Extremus antarcticus TaxID=702011 RepID=A0AAJ0G4V9_9PEZI|nr:hypothetical protein LTR09_010686 [Extremus antarcticus]
MLTAPVATPGTAELEAQNNLLASKLKDLETSHTRLSLAGPDLRQKVATDLQLENMKLGVPQQQQMVAGRGGQPASAMTGAVANELTPSVDRSA